MRTDMDDLIDACMEDEDLFKNWFIDKGSVDKITKDSVDDAKLSLPRDFPVESAKLYTDVVKTKKLPKDGHVKRPLNCFMLYSLQERPEVQQIHPDENHSQISKILGMQWKALSPGEQNTYREQSQALKKLHHAQFPQYKYKPSKTRRSAASRMKSSSKIATVKTAPGTKFTTQNLRTVSITHVSDYTVSGNHNAETRVQKKRPRSRMPQLRKIVPKEPLQQVRLPQEPVPQEGQQLLPLEPVWE